MIKIKDSRGKDSHTLAFVTIAFYAGTAAFIYSVLQGAPPDLTGYGALVSGSILPYLVREWTEKKGDKDVG